jgi:hypothetical protein
MELGRSGCSMLTAKVPRPGARLCESGFRLESLRLAQIALIRPALSCNQVLGRLLLKLAGCFEANRACEGVGAEALNHRIPMDRLCDRVVPLISRLRVGGYCLCPR